MLQIWVQNLILCDSAKILNVAAVFWCSVSFTETAVPKAMSRSVEAGTEVNSDFLKGWKDPVGRWGRRKDDEERDSGEKG